MRRDDDRTILAMYRLEKAESCLKAAELLLKDNFYADSANRSYYAVFHSMNALTALEGVGFKKHSGVLSHFFREYIKSGKIDIKYAKIAKEAFHIRTKSDYSDFYVVSKEEVCEQYNNAVEFAEMISQYIDGQIDKP